MITSSAAVPTENGSRYLQQLCKHWSHNLAVEFDAQKGRVTFPKDARGQNHPGDGHLAMTAGPEHLLVRIDASSPDQPASLKSVAASHLDRFAFREAPLRFEWSD